MLFEFIIIRNTVYESYKIHTARIYHVKYRSQSISYEQSIVRYITELKYFRE